MRACTRWSTVRLRNPLAVTYHQRLLSIRELTEYRPERSVRVTTVRRNRRPGNRRHRRTTAWLSRVPINRPEILPV
jgi:hypothetical protein